MVPLILSERSHKHAKINKFVFMAFGEVNLEICRSNDLSTTL